MENNNGLVKRRIEGDHHAIYISDISSPTRFYFQLSFEVEKESFLAKVEDWNNFYVSNKEGFEFKEQDIEYGKLIFAYAFESWDRAMIISKLKPKRKTIKLFFIDFGTVGYVTLDKCRKMKPGLERTLPMAHRGMLHGVQPIGGTTLWPLDVTSKFVEKVREKRISTRIVNFNEKTMTYEIKLKLDDSHKPLTEYMISENWAEKATENSKCLIYPSFNILETADFYPTFGEREYLMKKFNIDFNKFEEENIDKSISQVNDLMMALKKLFKTRQDVYEGFYFLLQGTV